MTNLRKQAVVPSHESYRLIPLTKGQFAIVDAADFDWLNQWVWGANKSPHGWFYATRRIWRGAGKKQTIIQMHNLILGIARGGDHESGNTLDNRRLNLRKASKRQQAINQQVRSDNTSGVTGVSYDKRKGKWRAYVSVRKRPRSMGYYDTRDEAIAARRRGEVKYYGRFVRKAD